MTANITVSYAPDLLAAIEGIIRKIFAEKQIDHEQLLTSEQVMKLCQVSRVTLQHWRDTGKIPFIKIDNKILYSQSEVLKALNNRTPTPANAGKVAA